MYDIDLMRDTDVAFLALTGTVGHVRALVIRGLPGGSPFFRFRNQMTKRGVGFDTLHFVLDDLIHLDTDAVVVLLDLMLHAILPVLVLEEGDLRYGNVGFLFAGDGGGIDDNLGVKNLLLDLLAEVIRNGSGEHALREVADFGGRNERIELRTVRGGLLFGRDGEGFAALDVLAEALGEDAGRIAHDLTAEDVADRILDDFGLLLSVVAFELRKILETQTHGDLVRAGRSNQVVQATEINGGKLVDDDGRLEFALLVDETHDAGVVQPQGGSVDALPVGVVADAEDLRLGGIVDVEREVFAAHDPVQLRRDKTRKRYLGRSDLTLQLVLGAGLPGVHKGREVVLQRRIGRKDDEQVRVAFVQQLDGVRERTVAAVLVDFEKPDDCRKQDNRRIDEEIALFFDPRLIEVKHDCVGRFVGVRDVGHEFRGDGIATMRAARVVEVDDVEFGLYFIAVPMSAQMVVGDEREVGKLVVVNVHGETFLDLLLDILIDYGVTFARAGSAQNYARPEGIDDIDPTRPPLFTVVVAGGQIHGILVLDKAGFLLEALVLDIERVVGRRPDKQSSGPDTGGKQADVTRTDAYDITQAENGGIAGCVQQRHTAQIKDRTCECARQNAAPRHPLITDTGRAQAGKSQKQHREQFRVER